MRVTSLTTLAREIQGNNAVLQPKQVERLVQALFADRQIDNDERADLDELLTRLDPQSANALNLAIEARSKQPVYSRDQVRREAAWHDSQASKLEEAAESLKGQPASEALAKAKALRGIAEKQRQSLLADAAFIEKSTSRILAAAPQAATPWLRKQHLQACHEAATIQIQEGARATAEVGIPRELSTAEPAPGFAGGAGHFLARAKEISPQAGTQLDHQSLVADYTHQRVSAARTMRARGAATVSEQTQAQGVLAGALLESRDALKSLSENPDIAPAAKADVSLQRASANTELVQLLDDSQRTAQAARILAQAPKQLSEAKEAAEDAAKAYAERKSAMEKPAADSDVARAAYNAAYDDAKDARTQADNTAKLQPPSDEQIRAAQDAATVAAATRTALQGTSRTALLTDGLTALEVHAALALKAGEQTLARAAIAADIATLDRSPVGQSERSLGERAATLAWSSMSAADQQIKAAPSAEKRKLTSSYVSTSLHVANGVRRQTPAEALREITSLDSTLKNSPTLQTKEFREQAVVVATNIASEAFNPQAGADAHFSAALKVAKAYAHQLPLGSLERSNSEALVARVEDIPTQLSAVIERRKQLAADANERTKAYLNLANQQSQNGVQNAVSKVGDLGLGILILGNPVTGPIAAVNAAFDPSLLNRLPGSALEKAAADKTALDAEHLQKAFSSELAGLTAIQEEVMDKAANGHFHNLARAAAGEEAGAGYDKMASTLRYDRTGLSGEIIATMRGQVVHEAAYVGPTTLSSAMILGEAQTIADNIGNDAFFRYVALPRIGLEMVGMYICGGWIAKAAGGTNLARQLVQDGAAVTKAVRLGMYGGRASSALLWTDRMHQTSRAYRIASAAAKTYAVLGTTHLAKMGVNAVTTRDSYLQAGANAVIDTVGNVFAGHTMGFKAGAAAMAVPLADLSITQGILPELVRQGVMSTDDAETMSLITHMALPLGGSAVGSWKAPSVTRAMPEESPSTAPALQRRYTERRARMSDTEQATLDSLLSKARSPWETFFIVKATANGGLPRAQAFADAIAKHPANEAPIRGLAALHTQRGDGCVDAVIALQEASADPATAVVLSERGKASPGEAKTLSQAADALNESSARTTEKFAAYDTVPSEGITSAAAQTQRQLAEQTMWLAMSNAAPENLLITVRYPGATQDHALMVTKHETLADGSHAYTARDPNGATIQLTSKQISSPGVDQPVLTGLVTRPSFTPPGLNRATTDSTRLIGSPLTHQQVAWFQSMAHEAHNAYTAAQHAGAARQAGDASAAPYEAQAWAHYDATLMRANPDLNAMLTADAAPIPGAENNPMLSGWDRSILRNLRTAPSYDARIALIRRDLATRLYMFATPQASQHGSAPQQGLLDKGMQLFGQLADMQMQQQMAMAQMGGNMFGMGGQPGMMGYPGMMGMGGFQQHVAHVPARPAVNDYNGRRQELLNTLRQNASHERFPPNHEIWASIDQFANRAAAWPNMQEVDAYTLDFQVALREGQVSTAHTITAHVERQYDAAQAAKYGR